MRVFGVQMAAVWEEPEKTLDMAEPWIKRASEEGGDLVCFAEQCATGWDPSSHRNIQGRDGPIVGRLRDLACKYGIAILGSFREAHTPLPLNTCIVIGSEGRELATYSKCHLFSPGGEDLYYAKGDSPAFFELCGMKLGLAICYDLRFGSIFHYYATAGVEGVLVPAAWPASRMDHWRLFIRARATEGQMYVMGINTTGITPVDCYHGGSLAAGPTGELVADLGEGEGLMEAEFDPSSVEEARRSLPVSRDRRPELYRRLTEDQGISG